MDSVPTTLPSPHLADPAGAPRRTTAGRAALRTVGVEEELLLVDPLTGRPAPVSRAALLADGSAGDPAALTSELQQEQVETATPPRTGMAEIEADLRSLRDRARRAALAAGAIAVPLATSPLPVQPSLSPGTRYAAIRDRFGVTCAQQLTCGCHVHVAVESPQEGVAVLDRIRSWLPVLSALATNSPFVDGLDTGYAGYRTQAWGRGRSHNATTTHTPAEAYHDRVQRFLDTGVLLDAGMFYADARLSHRYPTIEVRVADVCLDAADTVLIAALSRALVDTAAHEWRDGQPPLATETSLLRLASWRASRSGVEGELLHPVTARPVPASVAVQALLEHVGPALAATGDAARVEARLEHVLSRGTGATWQRVTAARTGDLAEVVRRSAC